jgi:hypothetical protein
MRLLGCQEASYEGTMREFHPRIAAMPQDHQFQFVEEERSELERVVEALAKWPRLSALLRYMGAKFFSGEVDQLNEYDIATEVLGRSKTVFNAAEDAIARVETHRLRKRLAAFYEAEGRDHPIQVTLPAGTYVPVFIHRPAGVGSTAPPVLDSPDADRRLPRGWKYAVSGACFILVVAGAYLYVRTGQTSRRTKRAADPTPVLASAPLRTELPSLPVRLLAGYNGPPRTDTEGRIWNPDRYYSGGGSWRRDPGFIARTSDPFLFEHSRTGDFSYSIPLKPGFYELHLLFSTAIRASEGLSTFNVWINGETVLDALDINADALGENIADERVFRGVTPGKDGVLRIGFSGVMGQPTLNAIEILPGSAHQQLPIRLITQTTPFTDRRGQFWRPDTYFLNGRLASKTHPLSDSPDPDLFSRERYGHFTYAVPVDTRGRYTLVLHFAEFYFGAGESGNRKAGSRIFKVMCNGETLLDNFDILKEAPSLHEVTKTFRHLKPSAQGKLNLTFEPIANNATVSGIEVLDESQ